MSVVGENVMFVSLPPRIERDCTRVTPGTMRDRLLDRTRDAEQHLPRAERAPSTTTVMREKVQLGIDRRRQAASPPRCRRR